MGFPVKFYVRFLSPQDATYSNQLVILNSVTLLTYGE